MRAKCDARAIFRYPLKSLPQIFRCASLPNRAAACLFALTLWPGAARAQTLGEKSQAQILTELQNAALKAFQQGNWGEAASGFEKLLRGSGVKVSLAEECGGLAPETLAAQMMRPENAAMREVNWRASSDADLLKLATATLSAS